MSTGHHDREVNVPQDFSEKKPERGRWYRLNVRLDEDEYRQFADACAELDVSPNTLIRDMIRMVLPNLGVVKDALATAPQGDPTINDDVIRRVLTEVYEQRARAYRAALDRLEGGVS